MPIDTTHLQLLPLSPEPLLALFENIDKFQEQIGYPLAQGFREFAASDEVSPQWLAKIRASTAPDPWLHGFVVIHRDDHVIIGCAGFKGPPDEQGAVEIAYGIVPSYQGKGYATQAAAALVTFAFADNQVRLVRAHTFAAANASSRVLAKCGFEHKGEVIDPEDGLVWRWERSKVIAS